MRQDRAAIAHPEELDRDVPTVDETIIEQLASITDGQGYSLLGELLHAFLSAVPGRLEAIEREVAAGDLPAVSQQAHALTGSAASFGARRMADLCRQLRVVAERGDHEAAGRVVAALHAEFLEVRAWLVNFRGRR